MKISVNNQEYQFAESTTIMDVFSTLNLISDKGMAIAVNDSVVPRMKWESVCLKEGDNVLLIKAASGG